MMANDQLQARIDQAARDAEDLGGKLAATEGRIKRYRATTQAEEPQAPPATLATDEAERRFAGEISSLAQRLAEVRARRDQHRRNLAAGLNAEPQSREDYMAERRRATQAREQEEREFQARAKQQAAELDAREREQRREYERFLKRQYS
jgi:hypothetical protein